MPSRPVFYLILIAVSWLVLRFAAVRAAYFPALYPAGDWTQKDRLGAQDVWITTAGVRLHAWWVPQPGAARVTLFLHGNGGNITIRGRSAQALREAGSSTLLLDYRGYGRSEGKPDEDGLYDDAEAAYQYLRAQGWQPGQIVIHGESLGTAVAVHLASRQPAAGVVLEAPFASGRELASRVIPALGPLLFWGFHSIGRIHRINAPLLVIHGEHDTIIPIAMGRRLFDAALPPKQFWTLPNAGHNDLVEQGGAAYILRLKEFHETLR